LPPLILVDATGVPVPLGNPTVVLYSIPYAVTAEHPSEVIVPASVAETWVIFEAAPVVNAGAFIPEPEAATLIDVAPPPPTAISPSYVCTAVGVNFTNISCVKEPPGCVKLKEVV